MLSKLQQFRVESKRTLCPVNDKLVTVTPLLVKLWKAAEEENGVKLTASGKVRRRTVAKLTGEAAAPETTVSSP